MNIDNIKESPKNKRRNKGQENTFELKSVNYGEKSFVIIRRQGSERIGISCGLINVSTKLRKNRLRICLNLFREYDYGLLFSLLLPI